MNSRQASDPRVAASERDAVLELTQALYCQLDFDGRIVNISHPWAAKLGKDGPEELVSCEFTTLVFEHDAASFIEGLRKWITGNPPEELALRFLYRHGQVHWLSLKPRVDRELQKVYLLARDITAEEFVNGNLPDSRFLLDQLGEAVLLLAARDGFPILHVNRGFSKLTGYSESEACDKSFDFFAGDTGGDNLLDSVRDAMEAGESRTVELPCLRRDGSAFWCLFTVAPIIDASGKPTRFISMLSDITERKTAIDALRENNRNLNQVLEDLHHTKQMIVQRERLHALGQMASGIAHDFNNLLAPIMGFSELLLTVPTYLRDEKKAANYLEKIRVAAQEAAAVVGRLREFYRKQDDPLEQHPVDLSRIAREAVDLTTPHWKNQTEARGLTVDVVVETANVTPIVGNESEFRQAVTNLIINAVDAMPEGGTITVRSFQKGGWTALEIEDTGKGMPEDVRQHCLEPFFSTKGKAGTGLGLSIVFGIVKRHEGRVDIDSSEGKGTRITMQFPASELPTEKNAAKSTRLGSRPLKIVVVDDEDLLLEVVSEHLSSLGHRPTCFTKPDEALQFIYKGECELVITDRAMPGMCGDRLAHLVKEFDPELPVILLTGFGDLIKQTGEELPDIDAVLPKPASFKALKSALLPFSGMPDVISE